MPYPILEDEPVPKNTSQEKPTKPPNDTLSLFEKLLTLVIAWQYFHFTGKAIANGKKLPKDWLKLKDRILPKKVRALLENTPKEKPPASFKVVDLATKEAITVQ